MIITVHHRYKGFVTVEALPGLQLCFFLFIEKEQVCALCPMEALQLAFCSIFV